MEKQINRMEDLTKKQREAMESLWLQEITPQRTVADLAKINPITGRSLVRLGLAELIKVPYRDKKDRFAIRVDVHQLTPAGHLMYCEWAARQPVSEEEMSSPLSSDTPTAP